MDYDCTVNTNDSIVIRTREKENHTEELFTHRRHDNTLCIGIRYRFNAPNVQPVDRYLGSLDSDCDQIDWWLASFGLTVRYVKEYVNDASRSPKEER